MLTCLLKVIYVLAVLIIFVVLRFIYLEDLRAGFKGQQRVATKIEKALEMFTPGFFDGSSESIYPKKAGNILVRRTGMGGFLRRLACFYMLVLVF